VSGISGKNISCSKFSQLLSEYKLRLKLKEQEDIPLPSSELLQQPVKRVIINPLKIEKEEVKKERPYLIGANSEQLGLPSKKKIETPLLVATNSKQLGLAPENIQEPPFLIGASPQQLGLSSEPV